MLFLGLKHTWIPGPTVCASVIARDSLDQLLKRSLIPRLMALAHVGGHVVSMCMGSVSGTFAAVKKTLDQGNPASKTAFWKLQWVASKFIAGIKGQMYISPSLRRGAVELLCGVRYAKVRVHARCRTEFG